MWSSFLNYRSSRTEHSESEFSSETNTVDTTISSAVQSSKTNNSDIFSVDSTSNMAGKLSSFDKYIEDLYKITDKVILHAKRRALRLHHDSKVKSLNEQIDTCTSHLSVRASTIKDGTKMLIQITKCMDNLTPTYQKYIVVLEYMAEICPETDDEAQELITERTNAEAGMEKASAAIECLFKELEEMKQEENEQKREKLLADARLNMAGLSLKPTSFKPTSFKPPPVPKEQENGIHIDPQQPPQPPAGPPAGPSVGPNINLHRHLDETSAAGDDDDDDNVSNISHATSASRHNVQSNEPQSFQEQFFKNQLADSFNIKNEVATFNGSGNFDDWLTEWLLAEKRMTLLGKSNVEKLIALRKVLSHAPKEKLRMFTNKDENYEQAITELKRFYSNDLTNISKKLDFLLQFNTKIPHYSCKALDAYRSKNLEVWNRLKEITISDSKKLELFFVAIVTKGLPEKSQDKWSSYWTKNIHEDIKKDEEDTLVKKLFDILLDDVLNLKRLEKSQYNETEPSKPKKDQKKKSQSADKNEKKEETEKPSFISSFKIEAGKCLWCKQNDADHPAFQCNRLNNIKATDILKVCKKFKKCINCFGDHLNTKCDQEGQCKQCDKKHFQKLHKLLDKPKEDAKNE